MEPKIEANNLRKTAVWKIYAHFQKFIFFSLPFVTSLSLISMIMLFNEKIIRNKANFMGYFVINTLVVIEIFYESWNSKRTNRFPGYSISMRFFVLVCFVIYFGSWPAELTNELKLSFVLMLASGIYFFLLEWTDAFKNVLVNLDAIIADSFIGVTMVIWQFLTTNLQFQTVFFAHFDHNIIASFPALFFLNASQLIVCPFVMLLNHFRTFFAHLKWLLAVVAVYETCIIGVLLWTAMVDVVKSAFILVPGVIFCNVALAIICFRPFQKSIAQNKR